MLVHRATDHLRPAADLSHPAAYYLRHSVDHLYPSADYSRPATVSHILYVFIII